MHHTSLALLLQGLQCRAATAGVVLAVSRVELGTAHWHICVQLSAARWSTLAAFDAPVAPELHPVPQMKWREPEQLATPLHLFVRNALLPSIQAVVRT